LSPEDTRLLQRAGNTHQGEIRSPFTFARAHQLTPALIYTREELHGKAMSAQGYDFKLRYAHVGYTAADSNISFYSASIFDSGVGVSMEF
jgi:hypothetical protein